MEKMVVLKIGGDGKVKVLDDSRYYSENVPTIRMLKSAGGVALMEMVESDGYKNTEHVKYVRCPNDKAVLGEKMLLEAVIADETEELNKLVEGHRRIENGWKKRINAMKAKKSRIEKKLAE